MVTLRVEVVLARPEGLSRVHVMLPAGATVRDAVVASGLVAPGARWAAGRHGETADPAGALADGERIEIYRALALDPKEQRRQRARRQRRRRS
jgi:putative ubiquitin-RnfH superfamily antitoxin RatB of RatAB toxin-antitoxin module